MASMSISDTAEQTLQPLYLVTNTEKLLSIKVDIWDAEKKALSFDFSTVICESALEHIQFIVKRTTHTVYCYKNFFVKKKKAATVIK